MNLFERAKKAIQDLDFLMEPYHHDDDEDDEGIGKDLAEVKKVLVDLLSACSGDICMVKFSCGCIGTAPVGGRSKIIKSCDHDEGDDGLSFFCSRDITEFFVEKGSPAVTKPKEFRVLDPEDRELVGALMEMRSLFQDGYKFRRVKDALR